MSIYVKKNWDSFSISARYFYKNNSEKTNENWFLYELTNVIYDALREWEDNPKKRLDETLLNVSLALSKAGKACYIKFIYD